jgi:tripartite-type tricarboxylate transporter receptor subunit TctC
MINRRRFIELATATMFAPPLVAHSTAQPWPSRFVRVIVPFPAGAAPDVASRLLASRLSKIWGHQVVGCRRQYRDRGRRAFRSRRLYGVDGRVHARRESLSLSLDQVRPNRRFCAGHADQQTAMRHGGAESSPVQSVADFIAYAKANKGKITYGSAGHGTAPHLCGELLKRVTGIEMTHGPYRAGAQQDLIAGRVDVLFAVAGSGIGMLHNGQARALAVTGTARIAAAPELPTMAESGLPDFDVSSRWGLFVPAKTAPDYREDPGRYRCAPQGPGYHDQVGGAWLYGRRAPRRRNWPAISRRKWTNGVR